MHIITDSAFDTTWTQEQLQSSNIHVLPQWILFDGKSYRNGIDIQAQDLYAMMAGGKLFPTTSMPSLGEAFTLIEQVKALDPEILIISVSKKLSGTFDVFQEAARHITGASISLIDSRAFSIMQGWQVEAAARAALQRWPVEQILAMLEELQRTIKMIFTLKELKYLQHSGRITHMKALIGSALRIKPQIMMNHESGLLEQIGMSSTFRQSLQAIVRWMGTVVPPGTPLRAQCGHTNEPESSAELRQMISEVYPCEWHENAYVNPVLGALAGPTIAGVIFMPLADVPEVLGAAA